MYQDPGLNQIAFEQIIERNMAPYRLHVNHAPTGDRASQGSYVDLTDPCTHLKAKLIKITQRHICTLLSIDAHGTV